MGEAISGRRGHVLSQAVHEAFVRVVAGRRRGALLTHHRVLEAALAPQLLLLLLLGADLGLDHVLLRRGLLGHCLDDAGRAAGLLLEGGGGLVARVFHNDANGTQVIYFLYKLVPVCARTTNVFSLNNIQTIAMGSYYLHVLVFLQKMPRLVAFYFWYRLPVQYNTDLTKSNFK